MPDCTVKSVACRYVSAAASIDTLRARPWFSLYHDLSEQVFLLRIVALLLDSPLI